MGKANLTRPIVSLCVALVLAIVASAGRQDDSRAAQKPAAELAAAQQKPATQSKGQEPTQSAPTFKVRVNLVQVKVVVRDEKGQAVKNLQRDDFQIYDQGKLQTITAFAVETPDTLRQRAEQGSTTQGEALPVSLGRAEVPQRYVAVVFDDVHLLSRDILQVRAGAERLVDNLNPQDRIGIFSTSGQMIEQFTSDKGALKKKLHSLSPRPIIGKVNNSSTCPEVTYYMADQAINQNNSEVIETATREVLECDFHNDMRMGAAARSTAEALLRQQLNAGNADNTASLRQLQNMVEGISQRPGERVIVLVSPGFLLASFYSDEMKIIEQANQFGVTINTLDARGLFDPDVTANDISKAVSDTIPMRDYKSSYRMKEQIDSDSILRDFSEATGGTFFHNSNDIAGGMQLLAATPESSYLLGYSPTNQKMDGKYHFIKVVVPAKTNYEVKARQGYYASKSLDDPEKKANDEIQLAVYSQGEIMELPLEFRTQYTKAPDGSVLMTVVSHVGVKDLRFRRVEKKECDKLIVTTVIFDENGAYVGGEQKDLDLQLADDEYQLVSRYGLQINSTFKLNPGTYTVRQVVRESEDSKIAAKNVSVRIPSMQ